MLEHSCVMLELRCTTQFLDDFVSYIRESVGSLMGKPPYKRKACNLLNVAFVSLFRQLPVILETSNTHTVARERC